MKLSLGFSPCPNDTFMFDALVNEKFDRGAFNFDLYIQDVEELNAMCLERKLDVSKISYHAYTKVHTDYQLLQAGSALGRGVGPLLISKREIDISKITNLKIAAPGANTTAAFLLESAYGKIEKVKHVLFSEIEGMVLSGEVDAGVIIHENRFTYHQRGLKLLQDLGSYWEDKTGLPIPLGGIVVRRSLPKNIKDLLNIYMRKSIEYAFKDPIDAQEYVLEYSQELKEEIVEKHIETYVNSYSLQIGKEGKLAVTRMFFELGLKNDAITDSYLFV